MITFLILVIAYFSFSWGLPWHMIPSKISFSYLFDLLFALGVCFIFRLPWKFKFKFNRHILVAFFELICLAVGTIAAIWYFDIETPFRLVQDIEWHLIILAPLLEELVFRQTFQRLLVHSVGGKRVTSMFVAAIFAFSHLVGLKVLPAEYVPFIGFQIFYTFILGLLCGQALLRFSSILIPVSMHFLFNLMFYFALQLEII